MTEFVTAGDGLTIDSPAIDAAIEAATSAGEGHAAAIPSQPLGS